MKLHLIPYILILAACQPPPQRMTPEERASNACIVAGINAHDPRYPECFTRLLPGYVQAETSRENSIRASRAVAAARIQPVTLPTYPVMRPRLQTTCYRLGHTINCY
jgi:hypothetical protein